MTTRIKSRGKSALLGAASVMAATLANISPIFGEGTALNPRAGIEQRAQRRVARRNKRLMRAVNHAPHIGTKQRAKNKGRAQFPEYVKLEARNIASGKWSE